MSEDPKRLYFFSNNNNFQVPGIHTGFSAKGGGGGDRGQGKVGSNCRVAFFIDLDDKQRTKLKSLLISKNSSGVLGGRSDVWGWISQGSPPSV